MLVHKGMEEVRSVLAQAKRLPDSGLRMEERWFFRAREVLRQLEQVLAVIDRGRPEAARIVADRLLHGEWRFESEVSQITEKMKAMRQAVFELLPLGHPLRVGSDDEVSEAPRSTMTGTGEEYTWERRAWYVGAVNARRKNGIRMANSQFDRPAKRNNIPSRPAPGFKYQKEYAYEAVIQCKDFAVYANTWKKQREEDLKLLDEDSEQ